MALDIDSSQNATFAGSINLADSKYVYFGASNDFYIGHTGSATNLINSTGSLNIEQHTADGNMVFKADDGSGSAVATYFTLDGGSAATDEYYTKWADNSRIAVGTGKDLQIYHDGSNSYISDKGTGNLYITASERIRFTGDNNEALLYLNENDNVEIYYDGSKKLETTSAGVTITGALSITGDGSNAATLTETGAGILTIASVDDLTLDSGSDLSLDASGNDIRLKVNGVEYGKFKDDSDDLAIFASIQDKDILFKGNDGGSTITALTLDMSNGGSATFLDDIDFGGKLTQTGTGTNT